MNSRPKPGEVVRRAYFTAYCARCPAQTSHYCEDNALDHGPALSEFRRRGWFRAHGVGWVCPPCAIPVMVEAGRRRRLAEEARLLTDCESVNIEELKRRRVLRCRSKGRHLLSGARLCGRHLKAWQELTLPERAALHISNFPELARPKA